jgi:hypothetical protein
MQFEEVLRKRKSVLICRCVAAVRLYSRRVSGLTDGGSSVASASACSEMSVLAIVPPFFNASRRGARKPEPIFSKNFTAIKSNSYITF